MPLDPLADLNDVLNSAFAALGARSASGQPAAPLGPSVAQQMRGAPERAGNMLMSALGPLGDAGRQVGEMMRTRSVDPRDLPLLAGNVLLGTMAPGGAEGGAATRGGQSLEDMVAALARDVGRGEAHANVINADVEQTVPVVPTGGKIKLPMSGVTYPNSKYYYGGQASWKAAGGLDATKAQGYTFSSPTKTGSIMDNDFNIHDETGKKIGSMYYTPEEQHDAISSTPAQWYMDLKNVPDLATKLYTKEELPKALEHAKLWNEQALAQKKSGLSDEELSAQLAKNPGASIFDIAGTKEPSTASPAMFKNYTLHESSEPGDYFVHGPDGSEVGQITKKGKSYSIDMNDGSKSAAQSPLEALQKAQLLHQKVPAAPAKPEMDLSEHLGPLNWESMTNIYGPASFEDIQARERARQLGFNIDNPLFKGGHLINYPENLYIPNRRYERGFFLADNPDVAQGYVRAPARSPMEYVARAERPMTVDWPTATGQSGYEESHMHALIEAARAKGADLLHIGNISDVGGKQDQYVVLDPSIVRAPTAQFDPTRLKEAAPLAGLAGLSAGGLFFDENGNMKVAQ